MTCCSQSSHVEIESLAFPGRDLHATFGTARLLQLCLPPSTPLPKPSRHSALNQESVLAQGIIPHHVRLLIIIPTSYSSTATDVRGDCSFYSVVGASLRVAPSHSVVLMRGVSVTVC